MRDVGRLVILDWLLERHRRAVDQARRPPLRAGPGAGEDHPGVAAEALLHRIRQAIQVAYDVESPLGSGDVVGDASHPGCWPR